MEPTIKIVYPDVSTQDNLPPGHTRLDIKSEILKQEPGSWLSHPPKSAERIQEDWNMGDGAMEMFRGTLAVLVRWKEDWANGIDWGGEGVVAFKLRPYDHDMNLDDVIRVYIVALHQKCEIFSLSVDALEAYEADASKQFREEPRCDFEWARLWDYYCDLKFKEDFTKKNYPLQWRWMPSRVFVKHSGKEARPEDRSRMFDRLDDKVRLDLSAWKCPSLTASNVPTPETRSIIHTPDKSIENSPGRQPLTGTYALRWADILQLNPEQAFALNDQNETLETQIQRSDDETET